MAVPVTIIAPTAKRHWSDQITVEQPPWDVDKYESESAALDDVWGADYRRHKVDK